MNENVRLNNTDCDTSQLPIEWGRASMARAATGLLSMLDKIQAFYNRLIQPQAEDPVQDEHKLRLAATALMVEVMRVDDHKSEQEVDAIIQASMSKFGIEHQEADELLQLASAELHDSTDYHQFTSLINRGYDLPHKLDIVEFMWQVAYADGQLDMYEEHVIRKVADLIYVPHADFIRLKEKVRNGLI